ncbi:MAG: cytochrome c oxidase subunit II [Clostridia bacterium]|nr:cytochrome c oxidase subunit II [Clostridia bacterium]
MRRIPRGLALASFALLAGGCTSFESPQSALAPAGPVAAEQLRLMILSVVVMTVVFVVVMGMLAWVLIRYRRRRGDTEDPEQVHGNTWIELTWTAIPVVILIFLAVPSVRATWQLAAPPRAPSEEVALHVTVVGHQFWWEFRYDDLGVVTANELHVPTGRPVEMTVTSQDVVHSFWIPRLAGKIDAIPGRRNAFWLQADEPGYYPGQCSQLCGPSHALMGMAVVAETPSDFDAWVARMKEPFAPPQDPLAARGMAVFEKSCAQCHAIAGTDFQGAIGPNLTKVADRRYIAAETLPNTHDDLVRWVSDAPAVKPGVLMPSGTRDLKLGPDEIEAVVAFLESQK